MLAAKGKAILPRLRDAGVWCVEAGAQSVSRLHLSSHLGLIRCLTLIVRDSTQHHIHTFRDKFKYIHEIILPGAS